MANSGEGHVEVYRARNLPEAHALRIALENQGIRVIIENDSLQGVLGELPLGWSTAPKLIVASKDRDVARAAIEELVRRSDAKSDDNACLACGVTMGEDAICPSCGWTSAEEDVDNESEDPDGQRHAEPVPGVAEIPETPVWFEIATIGSIAFVPYVVWAIINLLEPQSPLSSWADLLSFAASSIGPILVTLYVITRSGLNLTSFGLRRVGPVDFIAGSALMLFMLMIWGVNETFRSETTNLPEESPTWHAITFSWGLCTVLSIFMVSLADELVYRSYLITRLSKQLRSPVLAVLISAFLYTIIRLDQDLTSLLNIFSMGMLFGIFYCVWPRFWTYAIAHTLLFTANAFRSAAVG